MIGTQLGNYQILECLGAGGMGAVYLGEHRVLGRRAAIKVLLPELVARQDAVDRFFQEARAIAAIPDPGVVQIFDFGHEAGSAYLVMELLVGESLEGRLTRLGRLPVPDAVRVARQVATTLAAAHAAGIVHRDIKPDNLFLVRDPEAETGERIKVLDFGIAKLAGIGGASRTSTGVVMGTPLYMAPEQCRGAGGVDHRADIYALGCVLFHAVTGRVPFVAEGAGEVIARHLFEPAPRAASIAIGLPADLDALIARCLAKSPDERFADMRELAAALGAISLRLTGRDHVTAIAAPPSAPARTTLGLAAGQAAAPRRGSSGALAIGALVVGGLAAAAVLFVGGGRGAADHAASAPTRAASPPIDAAPDAAPVIVDAPPQVDAAPHIDAALHNDAAPAPRHRAPAHAAPAHKEEDPYATP
ncbi:MAG: serine/threonine protein kinase [Deltaproteobacteria bacterium]|nr:serine/threonine protein kinase [Deltaproteobacteria bacterium]